MTARPDRTSLAQEWDPVQHELPPVRIHNADIAVRLTVRRSADGAWRGHLSFSPPGGPVRDTAEIFCADSEAEFWRAVRALGGHHLRALYLSLA
jgi:hypothetical protein